VICRNNILSKIFNPRRLARLLLLSGILGVAAGLTAVLLQYLIEYAFNFCFNSIIGISPDGPVYRETSRTFIVSGSFKPFLIILMPGIGGLIVGTLSWLFSRMHTKEDNLDEIESYMQKQGEYPFLKPLFNLLLSVITLGTGGSGGKESPAGSIGASFGSLTGKIFKVDPYTRRMLMSAGVAAGIGAIFRIPVAATFFAMEFYYSSEDLEAGALLPSAIASAVSYSVFALFFGLSPLFGCTVNLEFKSVFDLLPYALLALFCSACAFLYVKAYQGISSGFAGLHVHPVMKPMIGGIATGLIGWLALTLSGDTATLSIIGDGFGVLQGIFSGKIALIGAGLLAVIAFAKMATTSLTIGSGGVAGLFSPSLVIGGALGGSFGLIINQLMPGMIQQPEAFVLIGMSAFFAAAFKTPICAIFIACELAGDYTLLLPSFAACAVSFIFSGNWTIYPSQLPFRYPLPDNPPEKDRSDQQ
jgi:chloride channel protein, CIC family